MEKSNKPSGWIRDLDLCIACLALVILIFVTISGVAMRYIVNRPLGWVEEVQLWTLLWVVFLGASAVARHSGHIAIDAFIGLFPVVLRRAANAITQVVTIGVVSYLGFYAFRHVMQMYRTGRSTNILEIPYCLIYAVAPVACLLLGLTALSRLVRPADKLTVVDEAIKGGTDV